MFNLFNLQSHKGAPRTSEPILCLRVTAPTHPEPGGNNHPILEICFRWVVQPPTRKGIGAQTTTGLRDLSFCHGWRDPKRVVLVYLFPCFFDDQVAEQSNAYHLLKGNEGRKGKVVQIVVENCLQ